MKFYKGCESLSFFLSSYVVFTIQLLYVYYIDDIIDGEYNSTLLIHKLIFCLIFILVFYTHCAVSFCDPGIIYKSNNTEMLEFYNSIYKEIIKIKNKYLRFNVIPREEESEEESSEEDNDNNNTTEEDFNLRIMNNTNRSLKKQKKIESIYDFEVNKCNKCNIIKPKSCHHCIDCHLCILERNNHCPWMNNCIGLFNKKNYLLFCLYSVISVSYSFCIYFYYVVIKNFSYFRNSLGRSLIGIFFLFFCFVYGGFCFMMLSDEKKDMIKEFKIYGDEQYKLLKLKMRIIFGGRFSLKWFFPCFQGGKKGINSFLKKKTKNNSNKSKKKFKKTKIKF